MTHHKVTLVIFIVLLFGSSYYFSRQTEITFSTNGESKISKVFPRLNPMLVIYDTKDEPGIMQLADSMKQSENVLSIVSYPTLLKEQYTATELTAHIKRLTTDMADYMPTIDNMSMLTPELLERIRGYNEQAQQRGETLAEMALAWILQQRGVTSVLVGASSTAQLQKNLKCVNAEPF